MTTMHIPKDILHPLDQYTTSLYTVTFYTATESLLIP